MTAGRPVAPITGSATGVGAATALLLAGARTTTGELLPHGGMHLGARQPSATR